MIVTAAAEEVPQPLIAQLIEGGIMVLPLGPQLDHQSLVKLNRTRDGVERTELIGVRFVPLLAGAAQEL